METIKSIIPLGSSELRQPETLPLSFVLHMGDKILYLIGTNHTKDPSDVQILEIEKLFEQFKKDSGVLNTAVVIDGRYSLIPDGISKEECIKLFGEQGYAGYLAKKIGIDFLSIEPTFDFILHTSSDGLKIKPEHLASWAFLNFLSYFVQANNTFPDNSNAQIKEVLESFSKYYGLGGSHSSIFETIAGIIKSEANIPFPNSIDDFSRFSVTREILRSAQNPDINGTAIQKAGAELNRARDYGIFNNILKLQETYECIFAVLGWNHVISELPAFEELGYKKKAATN